ncbi:MAG TPA: VTT domain-containing protein [Stellaceae bacterium]
MKNGATATVAAPEAGPARSGLAGFRTAGRILTLALLAAGLAAVWRYRAALDPASIVATIGRYPAAPLMFLAAHVAASLLFVPRTLLALAAGLLFGLWWGIVWAGAGSVIGATAGFLLARYVNGGLIDLENTRGLGPVLLRAEQGGWRSVAMLRLVPVLPHSLANYALGLTRLPLGSYALGSLLGQLPMTIAYVDFGTAGSEMLAGGGSGKAGWIAPTLVGLAALAVSILLPKLANRRRGIGNQPRA